MSGIPAFPSDAAVSDIPSFPEGEQAAPAAPAASPDSAPMRLLKSNAKNALSVADMVGSIPASLAGVAADTVARVHSIAKGQGGKAAGQEGNLAYNATMELYGNPFSRLLKWAGMGKEEGEQSPSGVDGVMQKVSKLLEKGGEWTEKHTGGVITKEDVNSLANEAMALGGGKGMYHGVSKLASKIPTATLEGLKTLPEVEQAETYRAVQDAKEPEAPAVMAGAGADAAVEARAAKVRIADPKTLVLDPISGDLKEAIPEMGKELPKPSALERGLEKASNGRRFDMTAEERIALKGLADRPLDKPIVDEQGKIIDREAFAKSPAGRGYKNSQRGSIEIGLPQAILDKVARSFEARRQAKEVAAENAEVRNMRQEQVHSERAKAYDYLANDAGKFLKDNRFLLQKVEKLQALLPHIQDQQLSHDASLSFARMEDVFERFNKALKDENVAPREAQNVRHLLGEMDHKAILSKYVTSVQEARSKMSMRSKYEREMAKGIDEALGNVRKFTPRESGTIDPKLMARLAAVGLGAWAGAYYNDDNQLEGAILGGVAGLALPSIPVRKVVDTFKKLAGEDTRIKINELADAHEKYMKLAAVDVWSLQKQVESLVPKVEDRNAISHAIEANDLSKLTPEQTKAAKIATDYFNGIGQIASLEGVLSSARENYVTHLWDWSENKGLFAKWMDKTGGPGMGTGNRFADGRSIPTIAEGKRQGLKPLTEDISAIMGVYGNSMSRSIANSVFTRALKLEKVPGSNLGLVVKAEDAPHSYKSINNPAMQGLKVHPDIEPSLKMLYDVNSPGAAMKVLMGVSDTSKRVAVGFSLFHAKALTDAMIGGSSNPFKAVGKIPGFVAGTDKYLQELRKGSASPLVERAAEGGLKYSLEGEGAGVEDAGNSFYSAMTSVQEGLDKMIPHGGLPVKGIIEMNKKLDTFMWARLHAGMKLNMFAEKYQQLIDNSAKAAEKDPSKALTPDQAARIAASYTNDLFGGLNWRRVAEDSKSYLGRQVGQAMLNPGARRILGILMFAPDWTVSTTRAAVKAFGKPDFIAPKTLAGLHQQYLLRAAMYYLVVGDAINYTMSGHHLWDNKDPTVLDMDPKGERHMQWSKHTMEPVHWLTKPAQQGINKMGMIPREVTEQALNVDYLSAKGRMAPMQNRVSHLAKNFLPISAQQADQGGAASLVSGFAGVPIYGKTAEQKKKDREDRVRKKQKEKRK